jgi:hypothetical protein
MAQPNYRRLARRDARKYGLDPNVFGRQIQQESGYNPGARSPAGAIGIAQFMPGTARGLGVNPSNPVQALDAAAKLMAGYVKQYGSIKNALVAYNAGPGRVGGHLPAETQQYLRTVLGGSGSYHGGGRAPARPRQAAPQATSGLPQAVSGPDARQQLALSLLGMGGLTGDLMGGYGGGDSLTNALLAAAQKGGAKTTTATVPSGRQPTGKDITGIVSRAKQINAERLPYKWGGGHGATPAGRGVPLDCSGAVSRLLNVSPRVSGDFTKFGQPGRGRALTIYANGTHVLMEIKGHFWGTSASNPGGGAGWIPRSAISPQYLQGFTARHPAGM